jgi:ankyrin repeat protein
MATLFQLDRLTVNAVETLIADGAPVNTTDAEGRTPLFRACYDDIPMGIVRALLNAGASVNGADNDGMTALHEATSNASDPSDLVRLLLDAGADVNAADHDGRLSLLNAMLVGHTPCVRLLLERGADPVQVVKHPDCPERATTDAHRVVQAAAVEAEKRDLRAAAEGEAGDVIEMPRRRL